MKIFLVANSGIGVSGYGLRVQPIVAEAAKRGYKVIVICRDHGPKIKGVTYIKPIHFAKFVMYSLEGSATYLPGKQFFNKLIVRYLQIFDYKTSLVLTQGDIFHSWGDFPESFKLAKKLGMITIKENPMGNSVGQVKLEPKLNLSPYTSPEEIECLKIADYQVAPSTFGKKTLKAYGIPEEQIILQYHGYDKDLFYQLQEKITKKTKKEGLTILFVGVIRERKDPETLLEAVKLTGKQDIRVILCGRIHPSVKDVIKKYQQQINLTLTGYIHHNHLLKIYNQADIFVFPSYCEGSAKATFEAMACGLPLITTENAGSVARAGIDGFIVPVKDPEAIKDKILFFYNHPEEKNKMGLSAAKFVKENYTWQHYGQRWVDKYEELLNIKTR